MTNDLPPGGPPVGVVPSGPVPLLQRLSPLPFAALTLLLVFFLYQIVGGVSTFILFRGEIHEGNVQVVRIATLLGQLLFLLIPTLVLARARRPAAVNFFRFRTPGILHLLLTIASVFALQQLLQEYMMLQDAIPLPQPIAKWVDLFKKMYTQMYTTLVSARSPGEFLFVVLVVALTPAFCEELLFRGLVQQTLEESVSGRRAAIATGMIFGAYHLNPFSLVPLVAIGAFFGIIVYRTQSIWLAIVAHFFNNFVACLAGYLHLGDNFLAVAPLQTPSPILRAVNFVLFALVFLVATSYFVRVTRPHQAVTS